MHHVVIYEEKKSNSGSVYYRMDDFVRKWITRPVDRHRKHIYKQKL